MYIIGCRFPLVPIRLLVDDSKAKRDRLEAKRRSDGWLKVGYEAICHDSRGNLVDGLGNPIKEAEGEVIEIEEEEQQHREDELRLKR